MDPRCVREHRERFRRDLLPELELANSYYRLAGRPDVGWLLLDRYSYNQLPAYSNTLKLVISDFVKNRDSLTITNLSVVQARCVTYGLPSDDGAIYLVQVTDNRGILHNPWFQFPVNAQYNVRDPAYQEKNYSGSLTGANYTEAWTWDGMVRDLWERTPLLGTYPGLPSVPENAPQGFSFVGVPLWTAITQVLDYLGMEVTGAYPNYTITKSGAADAAHAALLEKYKTTTSPHFCMEDSMEYLEAGAGRLPGRVVVYFHRRNAVYGTEEVVRYDDPQWRNTSVYPITIAAPADYTSAPGTGHLWSDFTVRYDQEGNPILADVLAVQAIAQERVEQYFAEMDSIGYVRDTYSAVLPFTTGSLVDGVKWFNTGKIGTTEDYCGWRTEVARGYIWPEIESVKI